MQLEAINQPLIGRKLPVEQSTPEPVLPAPAGSQAIPPEELYRFLLALSDLEQNYGYIDELQYALQRHELKQLERRLRHGKSWLPPESN